MYLGNSITKCYDFYMIFVRFVLFEYCECCLYSQALASYKA
jgi:hypothetical protein